MIRSIPFSCSSRLDCLVNPPVGNMYIPGTVPIDAPPGAEAPGIARAWGAALVLIAIVMALNLIARFVGRIFAVKKG